MVIWLIGISGAGKSTIAGELKAYFDAQGRKNYIIDGDDIRAFFDNDLGYTKEEREANIKRIILAAHVLSQNGVIAIVANIAPFEPLRAFARRKIEGYHEIFLRKDIQISAADDVKGMYTRNKGKGRIVGLDIGFDEPKRSDLVLDVDGLTIRETRDEILAYLLKGQQ